MPSLLLCMTPGVSLKTWERTGTLRRESVPMCHFAENGWRIYLLTFRPESARIYHLHTRVSTVFFPHARALTWLPYSHFWLRFKCDLILTNQSRGAWYYARAANKWNKPFLLRCGFVYGEGLETTYGLTDSTRRYQQLEGSAFRQATAVEVPTHHLKAWVVERYGVIPEKVSVIPNYVDTHLFRPLAAQPTARSVVSVGYLHPVKRFDLLIRACAAARVNLLTIYGDGPERENLLKLAQQLNINLRLPGIVENEQLPQLLQNSQVFAMTSLREGHPKSLVEAMACGLPCVGVDVVGIRECIAESNAGIFTTSEADAIGMALASLLDDPAQRQVLGQHGRAYVVTTMERSMILEMKQQLIEQCFKAVSGRLST